MPPELDKRTPRDSRPLRVVAGFMLARRCLILCCGIAVIWIQLAGIAQQVSEKALFNAAISALQDGFYRKAERDFSEFIRQFPNSEHLADASLLRMHAHAEALLNEEAYAEASGVFESISRKYPGSTRSLDAVIGYAWAQFKLGEARKAFDRLIQPDAGLLKPGSNTTVDAGKARGFLLLAEAALGLNETKTGEDALERVAGVSLSPALTWQRQLLAVRYQLLKGDLQSASQSASNLVVLARALPDAKNLAESAFLQANVLLQRSNHVEALGALELNLSTNTPPLHRRTAMKRIVDLLKTSFKPEESLAKLSGLLKNHPGDPLSEVTRMALGEVLMRLFYALPAEARGTEGTNLLAQARAHLSLLVLQGPKTDFLGPAHYQLGWGWWEENLIYSRPDRVRGAETNFDLAIRLLPRGTEQSVARFKLGDTLLLSSNYIGAASNYTRLMVDYPELADSKSVPLDQVLYQLARAWVGLRDLGRAREVSKQLTQRFPKSGFGERSLLLVAQEMNRQGPAAEARELFDQLIKNYPDSGSMPEARLGVAQSFEREEKWMEAAREYASWLSVYTNHPFVPFAEFHRASAVSRTDDGSNSFQMFTNFLARYPNDRLAPLAQNWVGDYFFEKGDFVPAEESYQRLYSNTNWIAQGSLDILYRARIMAARASFMRQAYKQAKEQLTTLINLLNDSNQTNRPPNVLEEAWLLLGEVLRTEPEPGRSAEDMQQAINAFSRIPETSDLAPQAWLAIAGCHLALAGGDGSIVNTNRYHYALASFQKAIVASNADIETRSQADYGLGAALLGLSEQVPEGRDRTRLQDEALGHFLRVFYQKNRLPEETPVPYYLEQCGIKAAETAVALGRTAEAANLMRRLMEMFPLLKPKYRARLENLEKQKTGGIN